MKNTLNGVNDSSDITGENISELEGIAKETSQSETQQKKRIHKKEKDGISLNYETTSWVIWDPKLGGSWAENIFKIMAENIPNIIKIINPQL